MAVSRTRARRIAIVLEAVLLVAAVTTLTVSTINDTSSKPDAKLAVGTRLVNVKHTAAAAAAEGHSGDELAVGNEVATNAQGRAQVTYHDGSLSRLDHDTTYRVVSLTRNAGERQVRTRMDIGRTWHRVEKQTGTGSYTVDTPVATASVRGTLFMIACTPEPACTFTVIEGVVEISPLSPAPAGVSGTWTPVTLKAGEVLVVKKDGPVGTSVKFDLPVLGVDPFVGDNLKTDGRTVAPPTEAERIRGARIEGKWKLDLRTQSLTGTADFKKNEVFPEGERNWEFTPQCAAGPCPLNLVRQTKGYDDESHTKVHETILNQIVTPVAGKYTLSRTEETDQCIEDDTGAVDFTYNYAEVIDFTVTATEIRDGRVMATAISGTLTQTASTSKPASAYPGCDDYTGNYVVSVKGVPAA